MDEQEKLQDNLKQQQKLASLGLLSAGIAHEVQNPLNFVINFSKMSKTLLTDLLDILEDYRNQLSDDDRADIEDITADLQGNMDKIVEHGTRALDIVQGILTISRGKEDEFLPTDICHLVKEYVWLSYHAMRANNKQFNVTITEDYPADLEPIMVIPGSLSRAILNLTNNAYYAINEKSSQQSYHPELHVSVTATADTVSICIADNGTGMSEEVRQHIYDTFFTTKPVGQGTGLGMHIAQDIIENKHGGRLRFETQEGEYTRFYIELPRKRTMTNAK